MRFSPDSSSSARLEEAARHWSESLEAWAIPEEILRAAPEPPWGFPVALFALSARSVLEAPEMTPSRRRALDAIANGGTVLDVGAGAGAASLPLAPPATRITAVDESEGMLAAFEELAQKRAVPHAAVQGRWPDVAARTATADVVVCHHVVYNVADIVPFLERLDDHAARRVIVELTAHHPQSDLNPLWLEIHGIDRPRSPTSEDLVEVLVAMGISVCSERSIRLHPLAGAVRDSRIAFARRRLCVGSERDEEIGRLLADRTETDREIVTLWWDEPG